MYQEKHKLSDKDEVDESTSVDSNKSHCSHHYLFPMSMNFIHKKSLIDEIRKENLKRTQRNHTSTATESILTAGT